MNEVASPNHRNSIYVQLLAVSKRTKRRKNAGISVTACTGCPRKGFFDLVWHYHQYPHLLWPALRETSFHSLIEKYPEPEVVYEHRFGRAIEGVMLTGQVDKLYPDQGLIVDYKTKAYCPKSVPDDYVWQANAYRYLVADGIVVKANKTSKLKRGELVQFPVDRLGIVIMTMMEVKKYPVQVLLLDEVQEYLKQRLHAIQEGLAGGKIPARGYADFPKNKICASWCAHLDTCTLEN